MVAGDISNLRVICCRKDRLKYAAGSSLYIAGIFVSVIVILELSVLQIPFSIGSFRVHMIGFPWLTEQVADSTSFWRMNSYTQQFPNVYFLNYGEALLLALILAAYGRILITNSGFTRNQHRKPMTSKVGFISMVLSMVVLIYYWIRMTVLWNTYVLGNTVYYPATTPAPTAQWLEQFGLPLTINLQPYTGGLVFHVYTSTVSVDAGLRFDAGLYITATLFFMSILLWKYTSTFVDSAEKINRQK